MSVATRPPRHKPFRTADLLPDGLGVSLVVLILWACTSETPFDPASVPGTYWLSHVSGVEGPVTIREANSDPVCMRAGVTGSLRERLTGGSLALSPTGSFRLTFDRVLICTYGAEQVTTLTASQADGQYEVRGREVILDPNEASWPVVTARARGNGFRIETRIPGDVQARVYDFISLP